MLIMFLLNYDYYYFIYFKYIFPTVFSFLEYHITLFSFSAYLSFSYMHAEKVKEMMKCTKVGGEKGNIYYHEITGRF